MDVDEKSNPTIDEHGNPVPVHRIQVRLARFVIVVLVVMLIALHFSGTPKINVGNKGNSTVYTSESSFNLFFIVLPVITGIIAFIYVRQPGIHRFFAAVLIAFTAWLTYTAITRVISNLKLP